MTPILDLIEGLMAQVGPVRSVHRPRRRTTSMLWPPQDPELETMLVNSIAREIARGFVVNGSIPSMGRVQDVIDVLINIDIFARLTDERASIRWWHFAEKKTFYNLWTARVRRAYVQMLPEWEGRG